MIRGRAAAALPEIDARLGRIRGWWQRTLAGETCTEAPNRTVLGRALVSGLDVARQANLALEHWQVCLDLLDEQAEAKQAQGEGAVEQAITRFNEFGPLRRLGRLDQAQQVVEGCLADFRTAGVVAYEASCLSALSLVWKERGDLDQAVALQRQALAVCNRLPDPSDRAISHNNLGNYLEQQDRPDEAARHHAAALAYAVCTGERDPTQLRNLHIRARRAIAVGGRYGLPPLAELLAQDAFAPLAAFLVANRKDPAAIQAELDRLLEQAHAAADTEATG